MWIDVWVGGRQQETWAVFMVQNVVEFELWQLDRIGGNTGRRRLQGLGGGGSTGTCVVLVCRMLLAQLASLLGG